MWIQKDEYLRRMGDKSWLPGLDAIRDAFLKVYGETGEYVPATEIPGMRSSLEGFLTYHSPNGYTHIATCGLSQIRPHIAARVSRFSGWGFEFTIKWPDDARKDCRQAFRLLDGIAEHIDVSKSGYLAFPPLLLWGAPPSSVWIEPKCNLLLAPDTEIPPMDTIHGEVRFRQILAVPVSGNEHTDTLPLSIEGTIYKVRQENPHLLFRARILQNVISA